MKNENSLLGQMKHELLNLDPVSFVENNLTVKGMDFKLRDCGREYLHDIYRYAAFQAITPESKPAVFVKGRQVEMSTTATAIALYFMTSGRFDNMTGLHTFPIIEQSRRYSVEKFDPMVNLSKTRYGESTGFVATKKLKTGVFSVSHKQFEDSNTLFIEGASNEANRLRNMSLDFIMFDEVQDILDAALDNAGEALSHSSWGPPGEGISLFFGTPKNTGTRFEEMWRLSDQRIYHLRCIDCKSYFPLYVPGSESWKEVWLMKFVIRCPNCGCQQDKRQAIAGGKWVPTVHGNTEYLGFHFNQLMVPHMTKEAIEKKERRYGSKSRRFMNEVLGEFFAGIAAPLSYQEIYAKCANVHAYFPERISPSERICYMGIDWGGKVEEDETEGSWTVITIISVKEDGSFRLEYTQRVMDADIEKQMALIQELSRKYAVIDIVVDMGYGHVQTQNLQKIFMDRCKGCWFSGNAKSILSYNPKSWLVTANRDVIIEDVVTLLKNGKVEIPWGNPEAVEWFARQCSSMDLESSVTGGTIKKHFVKSSGPCDALMSLVYAYVSYTFKKTGGFKSLMGNSSAVSTRNRNMPMPIGARIARR
jgi:hypothetical protein